MKHDQSCPAFTSGRECDCNYREAPAKLPTISPNDGEREAFEAWRKRTTKSPDSYDSIALHGFGDDANYADRTTRSMWVSWQARATLAAAPLEGAGVPVAQWQTRETETDEWQNIDAGDVEFCRTGKGYYVRALCLAAPQAQPEPSDAGLDVLDEVSMFDRIQAARFSKPSTPQPEPSVQPPAEATNRPSKEWYRRKIAEVGDADVIVGPAFQPPAEASEPFGYVVYDNLMGWRFHKEKPDGISANSRPHTVYATSQPPAPVVPLTDEQCWALRGLATFNAVDELKDEFIQRVRAAIETAHKIGDKP